MMSRNFNLDHTSVKKLIDSYNLMIPDFQRKFVWKISKKESLIDSIIKGFPIGAITLFVKDDGYMIIDGLQRINTITQFTKEPSSILKFNSFYGSIENELNLYFQECEFNSNQVKRAKSIIKKWYEELNQIFEYTKVGKLVNLFMKEELFSEVINYDDIESLHSILISDIAIDDCDIAMILYNGDINDLPELFRNINTGSVALSQYEILQAIWMDKILDKDLLNDFYNGYINELNLIQKDYEVNSLKEEGKFDIFKNMIGLNNEICSNSEVNSVFTTWTKLNSPIKQNNGYKYFENDSIAFELYSTLITGSPNKVVKAIEKIFDDHDEPDNFIFNLNSIILSAINTAIQITKKSSVPLNNSRYHSIYIICGIIMSQYSFYGDINKMYLVEEERNESIYKLVTDFEKHCREEWFINENRQVGFFRDKISELRNFSKDYRLSQIN